MPASEAAAGTPVSKLVTGDGAEAERLSARASQRGVVLENPVGGGLAALCCQDDHGPVKVRHAEELCIHGIGLRGTVPPPRRTSHPSPSSHRKLLWHRAPASRTGIRRCSVDHRPTPLISALVDVEVRAVVWTPLIVLRSRCHKGHPGTSCRKKEASSLPIVRLVTSRASDPKRSRATS